jgi:hypothetical protein
MGIFSAFVCRNGGPKRANLPDRQRHIGDPSCVPVNRSIVVILGPVTDFSLVWTTTAGTKDGKRTVCHQAGAFIIQHCNTRQSAWWLKLRDDTREVGWERKKENLEKVMVIISPMHSP